MYKYYIYGMTLESEIEFREAIPADDDAKTDATIREGLPPHEVVEQYKKGLFSGLSDQEMWFRIYDEILIYVRNGNEAIFWKINANISKEMLITYVLTGALTFLMFQRKIIPVHGSGISLNGETFIISGGSGSGKSTTALELLKKPDVQFVTDDICGLVCDGDIDYIYPGPIWQRLCKNVYESEKDEDRYELLGSLDGKYARRLKTGYITNKQKVNSLFEIVRSDCDEVTINEITGAKKVVYLAHNLFRGELHKELGITGEKMMQFVKIASNIRIYEVLRPIGRDTLESVVESIYKKILQR